jgi:hypothetical protein
MSSKSTRIRLIVSKCDALVHICRLGDAKSNGIPYCTLSKLNAIALMRDLLLVSSFEINIMCSKSLKLNMLY